MVEGCHPPTGDPSFDREDGAYHVEYDPAEDSLTATIVLAVAALEDGSVYDVDCTLSDALDPDALESLFAPSGWRGSDADCGVWFTFAGYGIVVRGAGTVEIHPPDGDR